MRRVIKDVNTRRQNVPLIQCLRNHLQENSPSFGILSEAKETRIHFFSDVFTSVVVVLSSLLSSSSSSEEECYQTFLKIFLGELNLVE